MSKYAVYWEELVAALKGAPKHQIFLPSVVGLAIVLLTVIAFSALTSKKKSARKGKGPKSPAGTIIVDGVRRSTRTHRAPVSDDFLSPITAKKTESRGASTPAGSASASPSPRKRPNRAATVSETAAATPRRSTRRSTREL
ncbi:hypothetical protein ACKKBG_A36700 [Auxenochlorella protothecoides x Auxenochlorella symbiontica]